MNIDKFLDYLKYERNYSNNTIIAYENNIRGFLSYCKIKNVKNMNEVNYQFIRGYISYLYKQKYAI